MTSAMKSILLGATLSVLTAFAAFGDKPKVYSKPNANDAAGSTSFDTANGWNGDKPGPGVDYVWNSWGTLRTPQRTSGTVPYVFAGDSLRFENGSIAVKSTSWLSTPDSERCTLTFPDLTLAKSGLTFSQSSAANSLAWILGMITVEEDFGFVSAAGASDNQCHYDFRIAASLKGGAGKTVSVGHYGTPSPAIHCPNIVHITGDNAAYLGKWKVSNCAAANTLEGMVMSVESATALGSAPDTLMADAVTLANNGALAVASGLCANGPFAPTNRGITLAAPAGRLTTLSDEAWSLGMPIVGDYPLVKGGAGRVTLCGSYSGGAITVEQGTLRFGAGFSAPEGMPAVSVATGAAFELEAPAAGATIAGFAVPAGTVFIVPLNLAAGTAKTIVLDAASTLPMSGKIKVTFGAELPLDAVCETDLPILTVPSSVRPLAADDIENVSPQNVYQLPKVIFTVKDNADGVQTVYAKIRQLVVKNPSAMWDSSRWWTATEQNGGVYLWEDKQAAHPGADYLVTNAVTLRAAVHTWQENVDGDFLGESLTFYGDNTTLAMKCRRMSFKDLRLGPGRQVTASGCGSSMQYVAGHVTAIGDFGSAVAHFDGTKSSGITLEANCHGAGTLQMQVYESGSDYTDVWTALTGDNSDFRGRFYFYSKYGSATVKGINCRFNSPENLGGVMSNRTCDGLGLLANSALSPTRSMTLDTANRGIYVSLGRFDIPKDVELTVRQPISLNGTLAKEGEGTLTISTPIYFGMSFSPWPGNNNYFDVRAGGVKPTTVNALKDLQITFRRDARLILEAEPAEADLAAKGVFVTNADGRRVELPDGVLNVEIDASQAFLEAHSAFSVPVCTVSQTIANGIDGKIVLTKIKGWQGVVDKETLPDGMVRFTANLAHKGMALIVR